MTDIHDDLKEFKKSWCAALKNLQLHYTVNDDILILHLLVIPVKHRRQGYGDEIMTELTNLCDRHNITIQLEASSDFGTPPMVLRKFYMKHGFIWRDKGEFMERPPLYADAY